ncbi:tumor protein p63-regulated gene 1-like protein isoform X3 [Trichogramma pretiosum]|uniref:tumor protein p63-regulated gene 1-like protein isoform X3 n=1 Tax=Trichogramma pretiosum TaxID=7493 RepID=UPI0006C96DB5|nr:tumor protein p63-regulated gene 1-like protein isoform X3 [Trichogramma pretiosum]
MDDTFLQDEEPTFDRATLEIKNENIDTISSRSVKNKDAGVTSSSDANSVPVGVPGIPYTRIDCHTFFSDRNDVVERALADCKRDLLSSAEEDELIGTWMLTEISLWDTEKERLVLLTKHSLYTVKYDLISLRILEYNRLSLEDIDTLVAGQLVYPPASLLPNRNMFGMRLMWNKGQPLSVDKKWNPFAKNIPWLTFSSHPLYWHKGSESDRTKYDVHELHSTLLELLPESCQKLDNSIVIENYVGLGSLVHNRTGLGFFKIRGKISF